ncbi:MAG TPA: DUF1080 domain-containing protein [Lacipirellulaceae bacterium]|nr:DUF1080 domain-containing protein [Lacipirellulaceae bacterium]HMP07192.1 DUF1080 domain-containing protein [Lacipirellulaceae bacterium]
MRIHLWWPAAIVGLAAAVVGANDASQPQAGAAAPRPAAHIHGAELGWEPLGEGDFQNVNCDPDTWTFRDDGVIACTGEPIGVIRSKEPLTNFELSVQWRHLKSGGNSGIFLWTAEEALRDLPRGKLPPGGIEVQVLDHGFTEQYEKSSGRKADWFTTHGDVFPVGAAKMTPFPPVSPAGDRSFPRVERSLGVGQWNHYYIRAINGEVRLWVNGDEASGGTDCQPPTGYLCLESEGAPVEFRDLRIRRLP